MIMVHLFKKMLKRKQLEFWELLAYIRMAIDLDENYAFVLGQKNLIGTYRVPVDKNNV